MQSQQSWYTVPVQSSPQPDWLTANWPYLAAALAFIAVAILVWSLVGYPRWKVWAAHQEGLADLAKAKNDQQVQIAEAQGRRDAAQLNKEAAVIEAEAVKLQIAEIGTELNKHDLYLKWQWIKMMEETDNTTIYVPTEANMPILEAGRGRDL